MTEDEEELAAVRNARTELVDVGQFVRLMKGTAKLSFGPNGRATIDLKIEAPVEQGRAGLTLEIDAGDKRVAHRDLEFHVGKPGDRGSS